MTQPHRPTFGVTLNNRLPVVMGDAYPVARLLEMAELAEELGFHSVWVGDSPLAKPRLEPLTTLAAVAARTSRVRLGTNILQAHLRNPMWLALEWATLDRLSNGRMIMGASIGAGRPDVLQRECDAAGVDKKRRGRVLEETLGVLRRLWTETGVSHDGPGWCLDGVTLGVRPVQPRPPIWIGAGLGLTRGEGPDADTLHRTAYRGSFDRVARLGDGWIAGDPSPEDCARSWPLIETAARAIGRDPETLDRAISITTNVGPNREAARAEALEMRQQYWRGALEPETVDRFIAGTPDDCIAKIRAFMAAGIRHFSISLQTRDRFGQLRLFAQEVVPAFR